MATPAGEKCYEVSLTNGLSLGVVDRSLIEVFPVLEDDIEFPELFEESSSKDPAGTGRLAAYIVENSFEGPVNVLTRRGRIMLSVHERRVDSSPDNPRYQHLLLIVDTGLGRTILKRVLDSDTPRFVPDPFFVFRETLFCIRERRTLMALPIGDSRDSLPA
jgi:hypothetical protein